MPPVFVFSGKGGGAAHAAILVFVSGVCHRHVPAHTATPSDIDRNQQTTPVLYILHTDRRPAPAPQTASIDNTKHTRRAREYLRTDLKPPQTHLTKQTYGPRFTVLRSTADMNPYDPVQDHEQPHVQDMDADSESDGPPPLASESDDADTASLTSDDESDGVSGWSAADPAATTGPTASGDGGTFPLDTSDGGLFPSDPVPVPGLRSDVGIEFNTRRATDGRQRRVITYRLRRRPDVVRRRVTWLPQGDPRCPQRFHEAVQAWLQTGTIRPSRTPWSAAAAHPRADDSEP